MLESKQVAKPEKRLRTLPLVSWNKHLKSHSQSLTSICSSVCQESSSHFPQQMIPIKNQQHSFLFTFLECKEDSPQLEKPLLTVSSVSKQSLTMDPRTPWAPSKLSMGGYAQVQKCSQGKINRCSSTVIVLVIKVEAKSSSQENSQDAKA